MKAYIKKYRLVLPLIIPLLLTSCSSLKSKHNDIGQEKRSCVNKAHPSLAASNNHLTIGDAIVYQGKAQGKETATCHRLDMNGFTAAHATLPLPSHIKITNMATNKAVVVKVNDRITQQQGVVLQVTPAVASILGAKSTFPAKIKVIPTGSSRLNIKNPTNKRLSTNPVAKKPKSSVEKGAKYYIVVGTYVSQAEAFAKFTRLSSIGIDNATMETRNKRGRLLHMVRIGPFYQQDKIDAVKNRLQSDGLVKFTVVKN